jgi:cell division protease FtsH
MPESEDRHMRSRSLLVERMATLLGGRTADELVFGEPSDGASNDLARVGEIAHSMVAQLGMSKAVGAINYADGNGSNGHPAYSDETSRLIDSEARRLVEEAGEMARRVLAGSRDTLDRVAEALMERETLTLEEVEEIAGGAPKGETDGAAQRAVTSPQAPPASTASD